LLIELGVLKFSYANTKLSDIPQFLLSKKLAGIISVNFGSSPAIPFGFRNHEFTSSDAAK